MSVNGTKRTNFVTAVMSFSDPERTYVMDLVRAP